jgi:carboxylate-amine ligase
VGVELFTLGVEEEFGLVDPATGRLVPRIAETLAGLSQAERVEIKPDVHQATLEVATPVCLSLEEVGSELKRLRHLARRAANRAGVELLPVGAHPNCRWRSQPVVDYPRYHRLAEHQGEKWLKCLFWGLHVHLGVPDEAERIAIANGLRPYLPLFIAFAANSPFWEGRRHPAADARLDVYSKLETVGAPPLLEGFADVDAAITALASQGATVEKDLYWDIRPRRMLPTVEVRVADMQTTVEDSAALVGLIVLAALAVRWGDGRLAADEGEITPNRAAAISDGLDARVSLGGEASTVAEALARFLDRSRDLAVAAGLDDIRAEIADRVSRRFTAGRRLVDLHEKFSGDEAKIVAGLVSLL